MAADPTIADLPATELRRLMGAKELSPVEVVEASLDRIERYNGAINAIVTLNESALDDARRLEERMMRGEKPGTLFGLPVGIKDVTPVAGLRTTYGSKLFADNVAEQDALVVQRFREAGAVIMGKTNCPEFAAGGNTFNEVFGRTRNPWDPTKSAGGSTGGGAAGLVTGMIALAEGTDLGGSLRIPASFCGVVGLRPSLGRVPTWPEDLLWDTLQVTGPMARTADDVALALSAISGPSPLSPIGQGIPPFTSIAELPRDVRVAYCSDVVGIGIDQEIERLCRQATDDLRQTGVTVEEVVLDLSFARDVFLSLRGLWFVAQLHERLDDLEGFGVNVANNVRAGLETTTRQLGAADAGRRRVWEEFAGLFEDYDFLVAPSMAVPPFPVDQNFPETVAGKPMETYVDWIAPTFVLSLTGLPVASAPCGLDSGGLPVGLQIVGKPLRDDAVLALAKKVCDVRPMEGPPLEQLV